MSKQYLSPFNPALIPLLDLILIMSVTPGQSGAILFAWNCFLFQNLMHIKLI